MKKQVVDNIAIYMRLSNEDEDKDNEDSESINNQRKLIYEFIEKNFEYNNCYEYSDDGFSGTNFNRPAFKKMIKELKQNNIELIITKSLSRFARNYIDSGEYIEKIFPSMGIRYIAIIDGVDNFEEKMENDIAPFKGLFNEMFCKETSKNIRKSKRKRKEEGLYFCPIAPYGYLKDPENPGKLIIDENVSGIVEDIFMMKYEGKTAKEISEILNEQKIPPPAKYLGIFKNRNIEFWTAENINRLVSKPVYVGDTYLGKAQNMSYKSKKKIYKKRKDCIITKNTHEPIISREIFEKIHDNKKYNNYTPKIPNVDTKIGDLIFCSCKRKMRKVNKNGKIILYCGAYMSSTRFCKNSKRYVYKDIEDVVLNDLKIEVEKFLNSKYNKDKIYKKYREQKTNVLNSNQEQKLENEKRKILFKISSLYNDRLDKKINDEQYKSNYDILINERNKIDKLLQESKENKKLISKEEKEEKEKYKEIKKMYRKMSINELEKEDFKKLIKKIELINDTINIEYNFKL